ncbi:MAG: tetratricopeptide repeat protein [Myxococcales bacterium]|nr:tetratricopeptide repeat protein [Myxococcales bacterium]
MEEQKQQSAQASSSLEICGLCGHANPLEQRFCGQCGAELKAYLQRVREGQREFGEGPQIQVTFLYGVFGSDDKGVRDPEVLEKLRKRLMGRFRLVVMERGGKFEDLGRGRFSATVGVHEPTEEDPLDAVTLGLKLLRLSAVAQQLPPLRLIAATGRIPKRALERPLVQETDAEEIVAGHNLLRWGNKVIWHCPDNGLFVDSLTYRMIRDTHRCRRFRPSTGVLSSTPIYEVESSVDAADATFEPPLVGREREIARMLRVMERVEVGEGPIFFTLTGELGIGKTRLLTAFQQHISGRAMLFRNPRERRRIDRWRRTPYSYFAEILRAFFEIFENEEDELSRQKLVQGVLSTMTEQNDGHTRELIHLIGLLCQVEFPDSPYIDVEREDPTQLERRAFAALTSYLERAASRRPLVFLLDNLFSADTSSIRLLKHLTQHLERAPILFVCASRSSLLAKLEEDSSLVLPGERMILRPLAEDAAKKMLSSLLPDRVQLPEDVVQRVLVIAEGNPFFLRECLRDLHEQGLSTLSAEGSLEQLEIPGSIEGILQARISRLQADERDVLQKAAVFGKTFWRGGVEMLQRYEGEIKPGWRVSEGVLLDRDDDAEEVLTRLEAQGVIQLNHTTTFEGEAQYSFVPSLLQELIYQEIPEKLVPPYHRLAAQWLELVARNKHQDLGADIAHHLELGELHPRAALYWLELGQRAVKAFSIDIAIQHLEAGLKHLDGTMVFKRVEGLRALAEAYLQQGQYADAMKAFEQLLSLSWQMGQRVLAAEVYTRMGWVAFLMRDFDKALTLLKNGHCLHQESDYVRGVAMALSHMGKVYTVLGDYAQARLYLQEALDIRRQLNHASDLAWTLNDMGNLYFEQGDLVEARRYHQESLELRRRIGHTPQLLQSMNNLALLHVARGDYDAALSELLDILELAEKTSDKLALSVVLANLGEVYLLQGELSASAQHLERAIQVAGKLGDQLILAECYRLYGELALERDAPLVALDCCGTAYRLVTERGIRSALSGIYRLMGQTYAALPPDILEHEGQAEGERQHLPPVLFGKARACFEESIATARHHGNSREEGKSRLELGVYEAEQGSIARGRYQLEQARSIFSRLGMEFYRQLADRLIDDIDAYQQEEGAPVDTGRESHDKPNPAAQTIQFRVTFDDAEMGPAPTPADIPLEDDIGAVMEQKAKTSGDLVQVRTQNVEDTAESIAPQETTTALVTKEASRTQEAASPAPSSSDAWEQDSETLLSMPTVKELEEGDQEETVSLMAGDLEEIQDLEDEDLVEDVPEVQPVAVKGPSSPLRLAPPPAALGAAASAVSDKYEDLETNLHLKPSNESLLPEENYPVEELGAQKESEKAAVIGSPTPSVSQTSEDLPSVDGDDFPEEKTKVAPVHVVDALVHATAQDTESKPPKAKEDALVDAFSDADHDDEWTERKTMRMQGVSSSPLNPLENKTEADLSVVAQSPPKVAPKTEPVPTKPPTKEPSTTRNALPFPKLSSPGMPAVGSLPSSQSIPDMPGVLPNWTPGQSIPEMPGIVMPQEFPAGAPGQASPKKIPGTPSYEDLPGFTSPDEQGDVPAMGRANLPFPKLSASALPNLPPPSAVSMSPSAPPAKPAAAPAPEAKKAPLSAQDAPTKKSDALPQDELFFSHSSEKIESFSVEEDPRWEQKPAVDVTPLPPKPEASASKPKASPPPPPPQAMKASRRSSTSLPPLQNSDDNLPSPPPSTDEITAEKFKRAREQATPPSGVPAVGMPPTQSLLSQEQATPPSGVPAVGMPPTQSLLSQEQATPPSGVPALEDDPSFSGVNPQQALQAALGQRLSFEGGEAVPVDPALFPKMVNKKPSVYDSQMIIAQVAEDDDISRGWFEEGRSDRSSQFWKERPEDRKEVREELQHEQIIKELEQIEGNPPKK